MWVQNSQPFFKTKNMITHYLKTVQPYFSQVAEDLKTFELRRNDRSFRVGDKVCLQEYNIIDNYFSGKEINVIITYILTNRVGLEDGFCIFSFKKL